MAYRPLSYRSHTYKSMMSLDQTMGSTHLISKALSQALDGSSDSEPENNVGVPRQPIACPVNITMGSRSIHAMSQSRVASNQNGYTRRNEAAATNLGHMNATIPGRKYHIISPEGYSVSSPTDSEPGSDETLVQNYEVNEVGDVRGGSRNVFSPGQVWVPRTNAGNMWLTAEDNKMSAFASKDPRTITPQHEDVMYHVESGLVKVTGVNPITQFGGPSSSGGAKFLQKYGHQVIKTTGQPDLDLASSSGQSSYSNFAAPYQGYQPGLNSSNIDQGSRDAMISGPELHSSTGGMLSLAPMTFDNTTGNEVLGSFNRFTHSRQGALSANFAENLDLTETSAMPHMKNDLIHAPIYTEPQNFSSDMGGQHAVRGAPSRLDHDESVHRLWVNDNLTTGSKLYQSTTNHPAQASSNRMAIVTSLRGPAATAHYVSASSERLQNLLTHTDTSTAPFTMPMLTQQVRNSQTMAPYSQFSATLPSVALSVPSYQSQGHGLMDIGNVNLAVVPVNRPGIVIPEVILSAEQRAYIQSHRSEQLLFLTQTPSGYPSILNGLEPSIFPFMDISHASLPPKGSLGRGVIRLKNIPFASRRAEIVAFIGRNSRMLNDSDEPVHIIMERVTSKTMDAYVEFQTMEDAIRVVDRHRSLVSRGRVGRLGERPVEVELSSQAQLLRDLFPLARGVDWGSLYPNIFPPIEDQPWDNFKGFITAEEMILLVKHVEIPSRSPFSRECPQRPFECMISTLKKMPWHMTNHITLNDRHFIFVATMKLVKLLIGLSEQRSNDNNLDTSLLKRLVRAGVMCPGFTVWQRCEIASADGMSEGQMRIYGLPRFSYQWLHQYGVVNKPGAPLDVLEWYIAVIREQTTLEVVNLPVDARAQIDRIQMDTNAYFGYLWRELGYSKLSNFDDLTIADAGRHELRVLGDIVRRCLARF